jgi:hypothetical protein
LGKGGTCDSFSLNVNIKGKLSFFQENPAKLSFRIEGAIKIFHYVLKHI